ncbi:hypothetical protein WM08_23290 [Burkholderia ubonensis]|uniref:hypothetical protein n=1 Tax=Burkholderia ubonensis TaxID=101571 RepID=UPI00075C916B|nr:hypothetical protein [Burkholderia ubonensis]KVP33669.1 hypothetical protein WJ87_17225 [Burkholderia ubonensis]KVQ09353.1 hypothetical protein WJ98_03445 [Burkholderia ubonensis]KVZ10163.1 hypothetical protein WL12_02660 [Burkholderia ubonensis]KWE78375.1 hypothetical protein WL78_03080 [Burkholderia ubonensis]KWI74936.1 hypothetical protein WM07_04675 [Burkholderia ubonensis]
MTADSPLRARIGEPSIAPMPDAPLKTVVQSADAGIAAAPPARGTHAWMPTNNAEIAAPHASRHATAAARFQRVWNAGGDLLLSGRTNVSAKVKRVWEPVFMLGASYQVTRRFWIPGMVTYIPLRTKITLDISQQNRTLASNTFDISANPVLATVLLNFRF